MEEFGSVTMQQVMASRDEIWLEAVMLADKAADCVKQVAATRIMDAQRIHRIALGPYGQFVIGMVKDPAMREDIAFHSVCPLARRGAVHKLQSDKLLMKVLENEVDVNVRAEAARCLKSDGLLAQTALGDPHWLVRRAAFEEVRDHEVLIRVAMEDTDPLNRLLVTMRLVDMQERVDPQAQIPELPYEMDTARKGYGEFLKTRLRKLTGQVSQEQWYAIAGAPAVYEESAMLATGQIKDADLLERLNKDAPSPAIQKIAHNLLMRLHPD